MYSLEEIRTSLEEVDQEVRCLALLPVQSRFLFCGGEEPQPPLLQACLLPQCMAPQQVTKVSPFLPKLPFRYLVTATTQ